MLETSRPEGWLNTCGQSLALQPGCPMCGQRYKTELEIWVTEFGKRAVHRVELKLVLPWYHLPVSCSEI